MKINLSVFIFGFLIWLALFLVFINLIIYKILTEKYFVSIYALIEIERFFIIIYTIIF